MRPADAPHSRGVQGHRLPTPGRPWTVDGPPVADPAEVFCQLGGSLGFEDLAIIADELQNRTEPGEQAARDTVVGVATRFERVGSARLVEAARASRRRSRSPAETRIRLTLDAAGIRSAELDAPIMESSSGRYLGAPDPVWRAQRVVLEYEGDEHRTSRDQFRYDIVRYDDLMADGWRVVRATGDHLARAGRVDLVRRVRRALAPAR